MAACLASQMTADEMQGFQCTMVGAATAATLPAADQVSADIRIGGCWAHIRNN
jgi:hypothetical protein